MKNYNLVVIGAGPGGYEVAIKASYAGFNVLLVEKDEIGGTCLNDGCIPTKALYKNAEFIRGLGLSEHFGVKKQPIELDYGVIQNRKEEIVSQLKNNIMAMLKKANVDVVKGVASFIDDVHIKIDTDEEILEVRADYILIATGSKEKIIPIEGYILDGVITSKEALRLKEPPREMVIIGGGVIGVEMASIFSEFGTKVVIVEYLDRLLPFFDKDISSRLKVFLKKQGIEVYTDSCVEKIESTEGKLQVIAKTKKGKSLEFNAEKVLMATGRVSYTDQLGLDHANILYDKNGIIVNEYFQTNIPHIYAVGDCLGQHMLAHVATYQSYMALDHILNKENNTQFQTIPACVFTFPEIASVGLTEEEAKQKYEDVVVHKYMVRANGKALSMSEVEGFVKVCVANNKLIGAHIIGPHASTMIHEATVLIEREIEIHEAVEIIHAHPTLSEALIDCLRGIVE